MRLIGSFTIASESASSSSSSASSSGSTGSSRRSSGRDRPFFFKRKPVCEGVALGRQDCLDVRDQFRRQRLAMEFLARSELPWPRQRACPDAFHRTQRAHSALAFRILRPKRTCIFLGPCHQSSPAACTARASRQKSAFFSSGAHDARYVLKTGLPSKCLSKSSSLSALSRFSLATTSL